MVARAVSFLLPAAALVCSALVLAPLLWALLFKRAKLAAWQWHLLWPAVPLVAGIIMFGPAVWQSTLAQSPYDNPGLAFLPTALGAYALAVALACLVPAALITLIAWFVAGSAPPEGFSRHGVALRSGILVGVVMFAPSMAGLLWYSVALGQVG